MSIILNPQAQQLNPPEVAGTPMREWQYDIDIVHPETQEYIVRVGEVCNPWNFERLQEAGCDAVSISRRT